LFFLGRENFPRAIGTAKAKLGKSPVLLDTFGPTASSVTIVAQGSLVPEALKAADLLTAKGWGAIVIHGAAVNHPDLETVKAALAKTGGRLVTVEEHRVVGGMGSMLVRELVQAGVTLKASTLGVGDEFGQSAYSALELYKKHGLDAASIAKAAQSLA
jgi:transketolase